MNIITLGDKSFSLFIDDQKINKAVQKVANEINDTLAGKNLIFLSVLNGSFMFTADLVRLIKGNPELSFIKTASYEGLIGSEKVNQLIGLNNELRHRNVVILEDIVDTGNTLDAVYKLVQQQQPASIKVAALFYKPLAYKKEINIDYVGLEIENDFIVGYGLDYNGLGRNLKHIYKIADK